MPPKPNLVLMSMLLVSLSLVCLVSDTEDENETESKSKQIKPSFAKVKFVKPTEHVKSPRKYVKQEEVKTVNEDVQIRALIDGKKIIVTEASTRRDLQLQDAKGTACLPNDTIFEELARMRYIFDNMVNNLEAGVKFVMFLRFIQVFVKHQLGDMSHHKKILVTSSLTKKVFANMKREGNGFSRIITPLFETMMVQAPEEKKQKARRKLRKETEVPHTEPQTKESVPTTSNDPLPSAKTAQAKEITDLKKRDVLDGDEVIVDAIDGKEVEQSIKVAKNEVSTADPVTTAGEVVTDAKDVEVTTAATTPQISKDELTLAQTLIEIKAAKPKAKGVIVQELSKFRTTLSSQPSQLPQAKDKANIAVIEQWDEVQAKINADMKLAQKFQTEEQEQLTDVEKSRLFMEFLKKRRKFFARKKEIKKRNRPPTKAQQRKIMEERSKKTQAKVTKGSSKRAGDELEQESAKRQRFEKKDDSAELKRCLEIVPEDDDDVTIEATPLSSKYPTIVV
nr:hypothetical protein [Tanacetum cinerariifolium]